MWYDDEPEDESVSELSSPLNYHPSWDSAPKDIYELNKHMPLRETGDVYLAQQMAKVMSHLIYEDPEDIDLSDIDPMYQAPLKALLPTLAKRDEDIYDLASMATKYVMFNRKNDKKTQEQAAEDFEEMMEEEAEKKAEAKAKGNRPGGTRSELWRGKPYKEFFRDHPEGHFPKLSDMDIMKNGEHIPDLIPGKPKVATVRKIARTVSDLRFCRSSTLAMPPQLFWQKYIQGEIEVFMPMKIKVQKQIKIVLLDDSSSMDEPAKCLWLMRIFNKILEGIEQGNSIMYFSPFLYGRNPLLKVETAEDAAAFKANFRAGTGAGTGLHYILPEMMRQISKGEIDGHVVNSRTEILIINDGQDPPGEFVPIVPIHAISVEEENEELKTLCHESGGQYYQTRGIRDIQLL